MKPPRDARIPEVRCTTAELAEVKRRAEAKGLTVSEFVRARCCKVTAK